MACVKYLKKDDRIKVLDLDDIMNQKHKKERTPSRSASCNLRLLNILFDNDFVEDFSHLGDSHTKEDLDEMKSFPDRFWDRVHSAYQEKGKYNKLIADDDWFNFDPK